MVMLLLLSGCAVGDGGVGITVKGISWFAQMDEVTEGAMEGFSAGFELGQNDTAKGVRLHFDQDGETYAEAVVALSEDQVVLSFASASGTGTYVARAEDEEDLQAMREIMQTIDTYLEVAAQAETITPENFTPEVMAENMQTMYAQIEEQMKAFGLEGEELEEMLRQQQENMELTMELILPCYTQGEPIELDGVSYDTININVDNDTFMALLTAQNGEEAQEMIQTFQEQGVTISMTGAAHYAGEAMLVQMTAMVTVQGLPIQMEIIMDGTEPETGIDVSMTVYMLNQPLLGGSVTMAYEPVEDASWLDVDLSNAQDLTNADDETVNDTLDAVAETFFADVMNGITTAMGGDIAPTPAPDSGLRKNKG